MAFIFKIGGRKMSDLFVRTTSIKTPCETYRCKNVNYIEIGVERGPANLTQRFCRECFVEVIRKAPADIVAEALGGFNTDDSKKIEELESKISELQSLLEVSKPVGDPEPVNGQETESKPDTEPEVLEPCCNNCEKKFAKKADEPCKSCKEAYAKEKIYINYKTREKKQED